jgi:hypothetical protein
MSLVSFDILPDTARLWIFGADRDLDPAEADALSRSVERGLAGWAAHGSPVTWGYTLRHDRFLLIGVDESATALSGCSIDNAVREIRSFEASLDLSLLDHGRVFFRDGGAIRTVSRAVFREDAKAGRVTRDTLVFNNVIPTVGDLRRGEWEVPAHRSWHAQAFPALAASSPE